MSPMSILRCPHCGTANRIGSNFCNSCGTELHGSDSQTTPRASDETLDHPDPATPSEHPVDMPVAPDTSADELTDAKFAAEALTTSEQSSLSPEQRRARRFRRLPPEEGEPSDEELPEAAPTTPGPLVDQPWLQQALKEEEELDPADSLLPSSVKRLVVGVQGLLDPVRTSSKLDENVAGQRAVTIQPTRTLVDLSTDQLRSVRQIMAAPLELTGAPPYSPLGQWPSLRIAWISLLLLGVAVLPVLLGLPGPGGRPMRWPGVTDAFAAIERLEPNATVYLFWAYEPAMAGELDLVARPILRHLLNKQARLVVVSLTPTGPAVARRLIEQTNQERTRAITLAGAGTPSWSVPTLFLAGGASVLPLLAYDPMRALFGAETVVAPNVAEALSPPPALTVVLAAQAEDVQSWLEQFQPLSGAPVVAIVSAGADLPLRPYWNSGQLEGLVSGFDGGFSYQQLLEPAPARATVSPLALHSARQNWGLLVVAGLILLGNLMALFGRAAGR
jgi:hypothetical protein